MLAGSQSGWAVGRSEAWLALLMLAFVSPGAVAQTAVETPRTIRVVLDDAYAPYSFQSGDGKLQGILVDQWQAWEKKTGIKVEIHALDWDEALRRMRAGEFDVIDSIVETAERRDYFDFTPAYATIQTPIFFRNDISGITDLASLKGFPVGVKAGDQHIDKLKENGVTTVIRFQNNDEIIEAAKQHKINVFVVDAPSALYLLNKVGIEEEFRQSAPIFRDELRRAVRKGDTALLREVSDGFAAIEPGELKQINEKWFGRTINRIGRYLTYAGYSVAAALLIIAGLAAWNRTLKKKVLQRTAALGESEQRFRRLVELMPVAVYVCDTSGIIQLYNHRAVELWGREPKSGDTAQRYCGSLRLWSPDGKLVLHEESKMAEVLRTGVPARDVELVIERPDGSRITALVNIAPLRNAEGELIGAMNCFQDTTERKLAEDALRQSEERFAAFMDNLPGYAWMKDLQGRYVYVNEMVRGLPGYRSLGKTDAQISPADLAAEYRANDLQVIAAKKPLPTLEHYQREGKQRYMAGTKFPIFDKTGAVALVGGAGVDITERIEAEQALRESEERFRELAENIDEVFWLSDLKHTTIFYVSPAYEKLWGRSCNSLYASPRSWMDAIHPEDKERVVEVLDDQELQSARDIVYRIIRPDGSTRWVHARDFPVHDENGAVIRIAGIAADITESRESEDALRKANRQLQILSRRRVKVQEEERRHLARELHDEIGQALTAAKINLQAAMKESDGAQSERIDETAAILERLLGQVRQISLDLRPSTLDDLGLVPAIRSLLDEQGRRASLAVRFTAKDMPENLDPEIQTTCFRIAQEAITNAVRHANATRIDVDLGRENGNLRLQVRDDGRGFDAESAQAQTVGLGLIGIKERAALVNARAKIISAPNKGTIVEVSLPLTSSPEREDRSIGK